MQGSLTEPLLGRDRKHVSPHREGETRLQTTRRHTRRFLTSKMGHYSVLLLVSFDVSTIFADFILSLYVCDHASGTLKGIHDAQSALGIVSLIFSCLFMAELFASIWAFGPSYFQSKFHCFDAAIILAGFVIDVCLKGVLEEIGSIVIVLRLWRVFKIIEELSSGAEEQMSQLSEELEACRKEKDSMATELGSLKGRARSDDLGGST